LGKYSISHIMPVVQGGDTMKRSAILVLSFLVILTLPTVLYAEDTTPPDTTITSGPSGEIDYRDVTFEWTGSDNVTATEDLTYSYKLEGVDEDWSNWTYDTSTSYSDLMNGDYTFKVKARDKVGNIDSSPPELSFTLQSSEPGLNKWSFPTEGSLTISSSPAIGFDGTIYVGSSGSYFGEVYAINPDGTKKWSVSVGDDVESSPTIGPDGTIYVGSDDNSFYAITPDGRKKWSFTTGDDIYHSVVGSNGTIYVGSYNAKLYAINPDGTEKWVFQTASGVPSPVIGSDGIIYVGSGDGLHAVNPDGTEKWLFEKGGYSSPAIGSDGTIYVGSSQNYEEFYALNPDGSMKWMFDTGVVVNSPSAIGSDGTIYVGSNPGKLFAVNPDGTKKWSLDLDGHYIESPAIGSDGTIYVGLQEDNLYAINPDGTEKWLFKFDTDNYFGSPPVIGSDGTIYIGSRYEGLYAIYGESGGLADSPWPVFQHDLKHTGNVSDVNSRPLAQFTFSPTEPNPKQTVTFDASSSSDPDGSIDTYKWDWNDDGTYEDSLSSPTIEHTFSSPDDYPVTLKVLDDQDASDTTTKAISVTAPEDTNPPSPNPMTWSTKPLPSGTTSIEMVAIQATDPEDNGVEYRFKETTGHSGSTDSGWQDSTSYEDSDLETDTQYCYRVKARDKSDNQNETDWSQEVCLTAGLQTELAKGWNIISPPGIPNNPDPKTALGDDYEPLTLYYDYSPANGYTNYPNDTESTKLSWEQGYWTHLNMETQMDMAADVPNQGKKIQFTNPGWNLIGAPYSVDWSEVSFSDPADFETDGADHVRLVSWSPKEGLYLNHYTNNSYVLSPWRGYWIYVTSASSTDPATIKVSHTLQPPSTPDIQTPLPQSVNRKELDYPPLPQPEKDQAKAFVYPNPATNKDKVTFSSQLVGVKEITVTVRSQGGEVVFDSGFKSGSKVVWDLTGSAGSKVSNGVYMYTLKARRANGEQILSRSRKLLILR